MKKYLFALFFFANCSAPFSILEACTGIKLIANDGSLVHGRTLEFGVIIDISIAVIPKGYAFQGTTPYGKGLSYKSKYGAVGCMCFDYPALLDGLNEKGLAVGTFYFPTFASYAEITPTNQSRALSPVEFPNWILTQFATVEEVKAALLGVVIAPTPTKGWGSAPAPFHYIVFDKTGNCLVIEPLNGKLFTYENKLGTFTNSPTFDWHMTHLRNFLNLTPYNAKPMKLNGISLEPLGEGTGLVGLPGDFTPPSRFIRAALFSANAVPSANANDAIFQLFHILNQFDIPLGSVKSVNGNTTVNEETQMICARDPQSLKYYFKSYNNQTINVVDLTRFDLAAKTIKSLNVLGKSRAIDISYQLK